VSEAGLRQYTFRIVEDDVARLVLRHINEIFTTSSILIGGESVTAVDAYPGEYIATLESLSDERRWSRQFRLTLPLDGQLVVLPKNISARKSHQPHSGENRPSEERKYFHPGEKPMKLLARAHYGSRVGKPPRERKRPGFSIGLSAAQAGIHHLTDLVGKLRVEIKSYERRITVNLIPLDLDWNAGVHVTLKVDELPPVVVSAPIFSGGVTINFTKQVEKPDLRVSIEPSSLRAKALVAALSGISADEAVSIVEWAQATTSTADDHPDYWYATSAALLLIKTRTISTELARWMLNLARRAPSIPDAAVVAAWASAVIGDDPAEVEDQVLHHLVTARRTGRAVFSAGQALAIELLSSLRSSAIDEKVQRAAHNELKEWLLIRNHTIKSSAFQIWEQPGQHIKRKAPGHIIALGEIGDNKLTMRRPPHP